MSIEWNGQGTPPVGFECEAMHCFHGSEWQRVIVKWSDERQFLYEWIREGHPIHHVLGYVDQYKFRTIRTEAERKREEAIKEITRHVTNFNKTDVTHAIIEVYDAIAAGKIPHITLK